MSRDAPSLRIQLGAAGTAAETEKAPGSFAGFLKLGIQHIGTGYDHLLFLFGLLIVARGFKSSLLVITCFTIAHSVTLAVATFNLVHLSSKITEPLIALSIVYVGVENILRRGVAMPLFSFNLGVELGQLAVAAVVLPIIWKLRQKEIFARRFVPACSVVAALLGTWWFCQRVWGS